VARAAAGKRKGARVAGVRARLLGLVLIPLLGLSGVVVGVVAEHRRSATRADELAASVGVTIEALEGYVASSEEQRLSGIIAEARAFGLDPHAVGALLGIDVVTRLEDVRARVDESSYLRALFRDVGGRAAVVDARRDVDRGVEDVPIVLWRLAERALNAWLADVERAGIRDARFHAEGSLHQSLDSLGDAAALYRASNLQLAGVATSLLSTVNQRYDPGIEFETATAAVRAASDDLLHSADEHLAGLVRRTMEDTTFDDAVARAPDTVAPGDAFDLEAVATLFAAGIERNATFAELASVAAADALDHAHRTGDAARDAYEQALMVLAGVVVASFAVTVFVARSIARPLSRLERRAAELSDGELDGPPLPLDGPREAAVLAAALNEAVDNLRAVERQAAALAAGDIAGASAGAGHGNLSALLQRSVDGLARSIAERQALQDRLRFDAEHDGLTGLRNRRAALAVLDAMLTSPEPLAVLFCDVDGLKRVNDELGHAAGDAVLLTAAERLAASAPADALVARLGGDEFLLATRIGDARVAHALAERLSLELEEPVGFEGGCVRTGASIGVALSCPGERADDLIRWADVALYEAKRAGRGRAVLLDDRLRAEVNDAHVLDEELRSAIAAGELEVHYQPIVDLESRQVCGVEALVRWRRGGELIPPDRFIGVAERSGTIVELDRFVLRAAAQQVAAWRDGPLPELAVSVNASARTLLAESFAADVAAVLRDTGLEPEGLEIEVTETALLDDLDAAAAQVEALHLLGVRTAIDDFGTGYTSVSQLRRLPVDRVKIDRSFVAGLADERDRVLVDLVIRIGHVLGVEVLAEGVETEADRQALLAAGCELAQGWLFGRPVPANALEAELGVVVRARARIATPSSAFSGPSGS
jgi:diguanylate cyclase (GGDEF)-like protein